MENDSERRELTGDERAFLRLRYELDRADIRWANERSAAIVNWMLVLYGGLLALVTFGAGANVLGIAVLGVIGIALFSCYWLVDLRRTARHLHCRCDEAEARLGAEDLMKMEPVGVNLLVSRLLVICLPWLFLILLLG